jgi:hypothetical protein
MPHEVGWQPISAWGADECGVSAVNKAQFLSVFIGVHRRPRPFFDFGLSASSSDPPHPWLRPDSCAAFALFEVNAPLAESPLCYTARNENVVLVMLTIPLNPIARRASYGR